MVIAPIGNLKTAFVVGSRRTGVLADSRRLTLISHPLSDQLNFINPILARLRPLQLRYHQWYWFLLRLVEHIVCIWIRTYADVTFLLLSEVYDLFQVLCVLSSVFICFPPAEVIFRSSVIGACPVTTDCIIAIR